MSESNITHAFLKEKEGGSFWGVYADQVSSKEWAPIGQPDWYIHYSLIEQPALGSVINLTHGPVGGASH